MFRESFVIKSTFPRIDINDLDTYLILFRYLINQLLSFKHEIRD